MLFSYVPIIMPKVEAVTSVGDKWQYEYTGGVQTFIVPETGTYKIEAWGAQGGDGKWHDEGGSIGKGFKGSYQAGEIKLQKGTVLNIYCGGKGNGFESSTGAGGWNGGGNGGGEVENAYEPFIYDHKEEHPKSRGFSAGGGGASDIRINGTALTNRILVAGGGGGGGASLYVGRKVNAKGEQGGHSLPGSEQSAIASSNGVLGQGSSITKDTVHKFTKQFQREEEDHTMSDIIHVREVWIGGGGGRILWRCNYTSRECSTIK